MQLTLHIGISGDLVDILSRPAFPHLPPYPSLDPISQLVKSLISTRTRDEVSWPAFVELISLYPQWNLMARASLKALETALAQVTFPEVKAATLSRALHDLAKWQPDFDLGFLGGMPVDRALEWLQRLDGVGMEIAAATLNLSTLRRPAFVIDTHVLRILQRYGLVSPTADSRKAYRVVMGSTAEWNADELFELHRLMKALGQRRCGKLDIGCDGCPLAGNCAKRIQ